MHTIWLNENEGNFFCNYYFACENQMWSTSGKNYRIFVNYFIQHMVRTTGRMQMPVMKKISNIKLFGRANAMFFRIFVAKGDCGRDVE